MTTATPLAAPCGQTDRARLQRRSLRVLLAPSHDDTLDEGLERLQRSAGEAARRGSVDFEALCDHVVAAVSAGRPATDDVALLALRITPIPSPVAPESGSTGAGVAARGR